MIFSLLNVRKKTAAVIAGIVIGALCLWAIAAWQNISREELLNYLLGTVLMLLAIMLAAFAMIACFKLLAKGLSKLSSADSNENSSD